jgi:hypothetical protein
VISKTRGGIYFGDAYYDIHLVLARHLRNGISRLSRNRIKVRFHHGKIVENVTYSRSFGKDRQLDAVSAGLLHRSGNAADVSSARLRFLMSSTTANAPELFRESVTENVVDQGNGANVMIDLH